VEHLSQLRTLRQFGCDEIQGCLFSPPVSAATATHLLTRRTLDYAPLATAASPARVAALLQ
jgi:EAL domain-containing protein (putative c-di-GMP-specific phosphodiesterase class I)